MTASPSRGATACFVAFGTRGDVQPLAVLACAVAALDGARVTFVTHAAHAELLRAPLRAASVQLVGLRRVHAAVSADALR
jgi:hypothetical protein